ncbi:MAG: DUF72 domain-containing protein [Candidatus Portnoybacteria bacterium]|nr:DUF72 domain-containing protein [Candidatus Portnoybacteria bacterium]
MTKLYIGTSGFSYLHWEKGVFYPNGLVKAKQLEYYTEYFQTVELNNPFYHLPLAKTFQKWYQRTPSNFIFAVKASRYISHIKKLKGCGQAWRLFISRAEKLKEKLGPILFQLPPSWQVNAKRLEVFLKILPQKHQYSFEFRHQSWFCQEIYQLLKKYNVALCLADSPQWPYQEEITADFIYLRLHGRHSLYSSKYTNQELKKWAVKIKKWLKNRDVYVYFNNDANGYAVKNAQTLKKLLKK